MAITPRQVGDKVQPAGRPRVTTTEMASDVYDPTGRAQDIFGYTDRKVEELEAAVPGMAPVQSVNGSTGVVDTRVFGYRFDGTSSFASEVDAILPLYPNGGAFTFLIGSGANNGMPTSSVYTGLVEFTSTNYAQVLCYRNGTGGDTYRRVKSGGTWESWIQIPGQWVSLSKTYTEQTYVTSTNFSMINAYSDGHGVAFLINTSLSASPGTTFRTIGSISLPRNLLTQINITLASQDNQSNLLMTISTTGTIQIYSAGTATGFYRTTVYAPLAN